MSAEELEAFERLTREAEAQAAASEVLFWLSFLVGLAITIAWMYWLWSCHRSGMICATQLKHVALEIHRLRVHFQSDSPQSQQAPPEQFHSGGNDPQEQEFVDWVTRNPPE